LTITKRRKWTSSAEYELDVWIGGDDGVETKSFLFLVESEKLKVKSMQNYKDLQVWKKSHDLTLEIYKVTKLFPKEEVFGLVSQLRRASSSIPTNIAEGSGRFFRKILHHFYKFHLVQVRKLNT
jgi:hypothetical protein